MTEMRELFFDLDVSVRGETDLSDDCSSSLITKSSYGAKNFPMLSESLFFPAAAMARLLSSGSTSEVDMSRSSSFREEATAVI